MGQPFSLPSGPVKGRIKPSLQVVAFILKFLPMKKLWIILFLPLSGLVASCGEIAEETNDVSDSETTEEAPDSTATSKTEGVTMNYSPPFKHDEYLIDNSKGMILLCHRAGWSRGEYLEIAPKLNEMGFSCIAIDQRSGNEVNGVENIVASTHNQDSTSYEDAIPDIEFAIDRAYKKNEQQPIILWGSSYSSTLALLLGCGSEKVKAIVSFSPGDYFPEIGSVAENLRNTTKPVWMTYSKSECNQGGKDLAANGPDSLVTCFCPEGGEGHHGSEALYEKNKTSSEYWNSLKEFLTSLPEQVEPES